jgi:hypothetical protein
VDQRSGSVKTIALSAGIATLLCGCTPAFYGPPVIGPVKHVLVLTPGSLPQFPIVLTPSDPTATLTASELRYSGGFAATVTQGTQCISVSPVGSPTSQFIVTRTAGPCASIIVSVTDSNSLTSDAYFATQ